MGNVEIVLFTRKFCLFSGFYNFGHYFYKVYHVSFQTHTKAARIVQCPSACLASTFNEFAHLTKYLPFDIAVLWCFRGRTLPAGSVPLLKTLYVPLKSRPFSYITTSQAPCQFKSVSLLPANTQPLFRFLQVRQRGGTWGLLLHLWLMFSSGTVSLCLSLFFCVMTRWSNKYQKNRVPHFAFFHLISTRLFNRVSFLGIVCNLTRWMVVVV